MINLNKVTLQAFARLMEIDEQFIGTKHYIGVAFFWNYEYRHYLRDTSTAKRQKVHRLFMEENLDVAGRSGRHLEIIRKITKLN